MDDREERALTDVEGIGTAVDHLRDLLVAAATAELRARSRPRSGGACAAQPPEP
jgi:hypothetical protein